MLERNISNPALANSLIDLEGEEFFSRFLSAAITFGFIIGAIVFVFIMLWGGVQWIGSGGDKMANEAARKKITTAFVGLVILFGLFAIINLVEIFFGVDITSFDINAISL